MNVRNNSSLEHCLGGINTHLSTCRKGTARLTLPNMILRWKNTTVIKNVMHVLMAIVALLMANAAFAVDTPQPEFDGAKIVWPAIDAKSINVHRANGAWIESLPGTATQWPVPESGSYFFVGTDSGDWTGWSRSVTIAANVDAVPPTQPDSQNNKLSLTNVRSAVYSRSSVELFWDSNSEVPFVKVEVSREGAASVFSPGTSFYESNLAAGTTYTYNLTPYDAVGNAGSPTSIAVTTNGAPTQATNPTPSVEAPANEESDRLSPPRNLRSAVYSSSALELFWQHATDYDASTESYAVYQDGAIIAESRVGTSLFVSGLIEGTTYEYEVAAINGAGERSVAQTITATTKGDVHNAVDDNQADSSTVNNEPEIVDTIPSVPNPPNAEQVAGSVERFNITVPPYVSNELQVRLYWQDQEIIASWDSDELWTASAFFPYDSEQPLRVVFYDRNGDITLGSYESTYFNSSGYTFVVSISANQFDTDQWDDDNDGVSNLAELRAGTDPLVHYLEEQPTVDLATIADETLESLAGYQLDRLGLIVEDLLLVVVNTKTIVWPNSDWYQVQNPETYESYCDGGSECKLLPGKYRVHNHTTGEKTELEIEYVKPEDHPDGKSLSEESYTIEGVHFFTTTAPVQRTEFSCENGGSIIKELVSANPAKRVPAGFNYPGNFDRHGYLFDQCRITVRDGPLPDGTYLINGNLHAEFRFYGGYGDHIEEYDFNGFSINGDDGLEYRSTGKTFHSFFHYCCGGTFRHANITEYFNKLPGDADGEALTAVQYRVEYPLLELNGVVRNGLTGGKNVTVSTEPDPELLNSKGNPTIFIQMSNTDGDVLRWQADSRTSTYYGSHQHNLNENCSISHFTGSRTLSCRFR